ncbi:glycosyltransferase family 2 protein [Levilactobacillus brevis]|uniref:glycosyltransferase family 2 protein n=2 Tax=Lactobacillales TaxID=186826 RepID=UPI001D5149F2|nr:glycosyltransferase family 2 protein [Levilactobacillus brevis]MBU7540259.1 glycosyltransferase [Levilactobacillus brevis]
MNIWLTIFTPTYNRANKLKYLYNSLKNQENSHFCWLIVDDGSTDETEALVSEWITCSSFPIEYVRTPNGGKQRAQNLAVSRCKTPYFVCADSDDWFIHDSLKTVFRDVVEAENKQSDIAGIIYPMVMDDGVLEKSTTVISYTTLSELYEKHGFTGETVLIFKTDILNSFPFPSFPGESFIPENVQYNQIDHHYKMRYIPRLVMSSHYQADGYSKNWEKLIEKNPQGFYEAAFSDFMSHQTRISRLKDMIKASYYYLISGRAPIRTSQRKRQLFFRLSFLFLPVGKIYQLLKNVRWIS